MPGQIPHAPFTVDGLLEWSRRLVAWLNLELESGDGDDDMWDEYGFEASSTGTPIVAVAAPTAPKKRILRAISVACPAVLVGAAVEITLNKKKNSTLYAFHWEKVYDENTLYLPDGAFQVLDADDESIEVAVANNGGAETVYVTGIYGESRD